MSLNHVELTYIATQDCSKFKRKRVKPFFRKEGSFKNFEILSFYQMNRMIQDTYCTK